MNQFIKKLILIILMIMLTDLTGLNLAFANPLKNIPLRQKFKDETTRIELKGGVKIDQEKQRVTLNLRNSDLRQVLRMLADKSGMNIIIHNGVSGQISLDLVDVELNKAFEYIMTMNNLTYARDDNTIIIANNEDAEKLSLNIAELRAIRIKYIDAQRIASFLNKNVFSLNRPNTSTSSIVTTNPGTNEILIFGSEEDIALAEEVIEYLDIQPEINNFLGNYANPVELASKICWTAFKSSEGEASFSRSADLSEGSEISMVCGNTSETSESSGSGSLDDYDTPSYWVLADTGLNQITIYGGTKEQIGMAQQIVKNYDKREPQVYLEVSVLELSESDAKSLEFQYNIFNTIDGAYAEGSFLSFLDGTFQVQGIRHLAKTNLGQSYLNDSTPSEGLNPAFLQTLLTNSKARLLANPRIITANNVTANINISEDVIQSVTSTTTDTGLVTQEVTIGPGDAISFSITPKISPNGYVTISIPDFTLSAYRGTSEAGGAAAGLTASRTVSVKNVRVKDGKTLVIGGLIQEREETEHQKLPILSDIPILGTFFQQQSTTKVRSELIIMITPRILKDPDEVAESI